MARLAVHFSDPVVTSISRPLDATENDLIRRFERHVWECPTCAIPFTWRRSGISLCLRASELAKEVVRHWCYHKGMILSKVRKEDCQIRIEVPHEYGAVWDLLYAQHWKRPIARSSRGGRFHAGISRYRQDESLQSYSTPFTRDHNAPSSTYWNGSHDRFQDSGYINAFDELQETYKMVRRIVRRYWYYA